jgi:TPR repeat protein
MILKANKINLCFIVIAAFIASEAQAMLLPRTPLTAQQITNLEERAAHGDTIADLQLAYNYYIPDTPGSWPAYKNNNQAMVYFKQAAEAGDLIAQTYVGFLYERGKGIDHDYAAALKWYKLAATKGYMPAQDLIGRMYRDGRGVAQNYGVAAEIFKNAAIQYYSISANHLGRLYFTGGPGLRQDYKEALFWLDFPSNPAFRDINRSLPVDFCCEKEDYVPYDQEAQKHLTSEEIKQIKQQIADFKMPTQRIPFAFSFD